jgi:hypothetical protein
VRAAFLLLPLVLALGGCFGPAGAGLDTYKDRTLTFVLDSGIPAANRTADAFYLVWIHGEEHVRPIAGKGAVAKRPCDATPSVRYDEGEGILRYDDRRHTVDTHGLEILVALEYRGDRVFPDAYGAGCATQSALAAYAGRAEFAGSIRPDLAIDLIGEPQNGFLTYNKAYFFPVGKKVHTNLTRVERTNDGHAYYVTGDFEILNLGLWTSDRLAAFARP